MTRIDLLTSPGGDDNQLVQDDGAGGIKAGPRFTVASSEPAAASNDDVWVDTSEAASPVVKVRIGGTWIATAGGGGAPETWVGKVLAKEPTYAWLMVEDSGSTVADDGDANDPLTLVGSPDLDIAGPGVGGGLAFNTSAYGHGTLTDRLFDGPITLEFFIRIKEPSITDTYVIADNRHSSASGGASLRLSDTGWTFARYGTDSVTVGGALLPSQDVWAHVILVRDGTDLRVWVDSIMNSDSTTISSGGVASTDNPIHINSWARDAPDNGRELDFGPYVVYPLAFSESDAEDHFEAAA